MGFGIGFERRRARCDAEFVFGNQYVDRVGGTSQLATCQAVTNCLENEEGELVNNAPQATIHN
jgi:hypothetical protein